MQRRGFTFFARKPAFGEDEPGTITWWGTSVECASAVSRLEREDKLSARAATEALERLDALARHWHRIEQAEKYP